MNKVKLNSSTLLLVSLLFLSCFAGLTYQAFQINSRLQYDAEAINNAGIIRGSIQRYSKLVMAGCVPECTPVKHVIDDHLSRFIDHRYPNEDIRSDQLFRQKLLELRDLWQQLQQLSAPEQIHLAHGQQDFITLSEKVWAHADQTVFIAQKRSEYRLDNLDLFYPLIFLLFVLSMGLLILVFKTVRYELEYEVGKDPLTGLNNRRVFDHELAQKIALSKRYNTPLSLIYIDIDHFKAINDQHGHECGDILLKEVASFITANIRNVDIFCRIGGEEFAIIVPDSDKADCLKLAQKLLSEISHHEFHACINITASIGISTYHPSMDLGAFVNSADNAMYKAKQSGRNRIEVCSLDEQLNSVF